MKAKKYFKTVDFISILTIVVLSLKFVKYFNSDWSIIMAGVFWTYLRDYVDEKEVKRRKGRLEEGRSGGLWVFVWVAFALTLFVFIKIDPDRYCFPAPEITVILSFVISRYRKSRLYKKSFEKGQEEPINSSLSPGLHVIIIESS